METVEIENKPAFNFIQFLQFQMQNRKFEIKEIYRSKSKTTVVFFELGKGEKLIERSAEYLSSLNLQYLGINYNRAKEKGIIF